MAISKSSISISWRKYALCILQDTGLIGSKLVAFSMKSNLKLTATNSNIYKDTSAYKRLVGRLLYLTITRSNLAFVVQFLGQFLTNPIVSHYKVDVRVLKYLKATSVQGLFFSSSDLRLRAFSNSDWTGCIDH